MNGVLQNAARVVGFVARLMRLVQSGYVYRYAFAMIFGLLLIMSWWWYRGAFAA